MANEPAAPATITPAAAPAATPAPAAAEPSAAAVTSPPASAAAPVAVAAAAEPAPALITGESLLGAAPPPPPAPVAEPAKPAAEVLKPGDPAKAATEAKPGEASPAATVSPAEKNFAYQPFKLPEGAQSYDEARMGEFQKILTKAAPTQEAAQALGQELVDFHVAELAKVAERTTALNTETWKTTNDQWRDQVRADPEIGGNRLETALADANRVIALHGGSPEQQAALRQVLNFTGAGNHPDMVRFLARVGKALGEGSPIPALKPAAPKPQTRSERRYGGVNGAQQPQGA